MKEFYRQLRQDKILFGGFVISILLIIFTFFYILFLYRSLPPFIPLFNQLPWGGQRLGTTPQIFLPVGLAFIIALGNLFLAVYVYKNMPLAARILCVTSTLTSFFACVFTIRTILLIL